MVILGFLNLILDLILLVLVVSIVVMLFRFLAIVTNETSAGLLTLVILTGVHIPLVYRVLLGAACYCVSKKALKYKRTYIALSTCISVMVGFMLVQWPGLSAVRFLMGESRSGGIVCNSWICVFTLITAGVLLYNKLGFTPDSFETEKYPLLQRIAASLIFGASAALIVAAAIGTSAWMVAIAAALAAYALDPGDKLKVGYIKIERHSAGSSVSKYAAGASSNTLFGETDPETGCFRYSSGNSERESYDRWERERSYNDYLIRREEESRFQQSQAEDSWWSRQSWEQDQYWQEQSYYNDDSY